MTTLRKNQLKYFDKLISYDSRLHTTLTKNHDIYKWFGFQTELDKFDDIGTADMTHGFFTLSFRKLWWDRNVIKYTKETL